MASSAQPSSAIGVWISSQPKGNAKTTAASNAMLPTACPATGQHRKKIHTDVAKKMSSIMAAVYKEDPVYVK